MRIKLRQNNSVSLDLVLFLLLPIFVSFFGPHWDFWISGSTWTPPTVITKISHALIGLFFFPIGVMTIHWSLSHLWTNQPKRPFFGLSSGLQIITFMAFVNHKHKKPTCQNQDSTRLMVGSSHICHGQNLSLIIYGVLSCHPTISRDTS